MNKEERPNQMSLETMIRFYKVPLLVGLVVVVVAFLGWNQIGGILEQQQKLSADKNQVEQLDKRLVILKSQANGGMDQAKTVVARALPEEKPVFEAFSALTTLADETGVAVKQLNSTPGSLATGSGSLNSESSGVKSVQMNLSLEGEELAVKNYLTKVIEVVPLIDLDKVSLSSRLAVEGEPLKYQLQVELSIYWMPAIKSGGKVTKTPELTPAQEAAVQELMGYQYYGIR